MDHVGFQSQHGATWNSPGIVPMEFSGYPHPPFTSPPATPMTPMTPATLNHTFPIPQYDVPPHIFHNPPPPPPPFPPPPDYRLFALCQHLQTYTKVPETELEVKRWWEEFMTEFFHDNSTLVIETDLGEGTRKYHLSRQWISLYFRSLMEHGVTSVHLDLGQCISTYHQNLQVLECHNTTMETHHTSPHPTKVCTNGSLMVDFSLEDKPRILSWYFSIKDHVEYIPRGSFTQQGNEAGTLENVTNKGILPSTQKLLLEAGRIESSNYHHESPLGSNTRTPSADGMARWQELPSLIHIQQVGLDVMHPGQLPPDAAALSAGGGVIQSMSPGGSIANSMGLLSNSPTSCLLPNTSSSSNASGSSKGKSSRSSSSSGGSRKRQSPIPGAGGSSSKKIQQQFMLIAAEAVPLKDADLPFGLDERMITRIDNRSNSPQTPSIPSKSSPTNINGHGVVNGNTTTATSKLCHINNHHERALSTTVDSSAQGVELGQGPPEVYGSPLQPVPWGATDGIALMNHHSALTSSR